jgi:hypothetical protein
MAVVSRTVTTAILASSVLFAFSARAEDFVELPAEHEAPPADESPPLPIGPQRPDHLLKIEHSIRGRRVDLPVVSVQVNGRPAWMVLDTGASTHVLSWRLVQALGLPLSRSGTGKDHLGQDFDAGLVEGAIIESHGWVLVDHGSVGGTDLSGQLEKLGIDGLLSPQLLAGRGQSVILDLAAGVLWTAPHAEGEAQFRGKRIGLTPPWPRTCERPDRAPFRLYVVPAIIEGTAQGLLIDTGATHTNLSLSALRGTQLKPAAQGRGGGGARHGSRLRAADIRIGGFEATGDIPLVAGAPNDLCHYDGELGLDILSTCTLVLDATQAAIGCR